MPGRYEFSLPPRRQRDGWFRLGGFDITTTALAVLAGVVSMFVYAASRSVLEKLVFYGPYVRRGDVWRLVTWPIANPPTEIWVVITLAFFWFFGHIVEERVGRKPYTWLLLAMTVIPAAIVTMFRFTLETSAAYGLGLLGTGLLVVFALDAPNAPFFFGIPAWVIAIIFVGLDLLRLLGDRMHGALVMEVLTIVVAGIGARQLGMASELLGFIPRLGGHRGSTRRPAPARHRRARGEVEPRRRRGEVVDGPWTPSTSQDPSFDHVHDQAELDALLDKISSSGMDSLTRADKERLNELSKRLRGR